MRDDLIPTGAGTEVLDVRGLGVHFQAVDGEVEAVRDLSFTVRAGEIVGLVGESGSGKSVTALAIMGLLTPGLSRVTGSVVLNGRELLGLRRDRMAKIRGREISMIFQEPMTALDPVFRVGEQITETIRCQQQVSRKAARARAIEVLDDVGIPDPASRAEAYPHQLSGGMRQRVMIAIALVSEPSILIADEPTTALDVTIQAQILQLLRRLSRDHGTGVLLITHDLGVVAETCSRVRTMYAGELIEECTVDEALLTPHHPYTSGLIRAIPRSEQRRQVLYSIPGRVPALTAMPPGCRFEPRCEHSQPECLGPQRLLAFGDRSVRCWRHAELDLPGAVAEVTR
jgi:peptide/nickel transport system ATP-binding protein